MGFYGYREFGSPGSFGAFGYVGTGVVGDIGFNTNYADSLWRNGGLGAPYSPPTSSVLSRAATQWQKLQELIDTNAPSGARARQRLQSLRDTLSYYVSTLESWVADRYDFQRERADGWVAANPVRVYNGINAKLKEFGDEVWPEAYEEIAQAEEAAAAKAKADAAAAKAAADAAKAAQAKAAAQAAAEAAKLHNTQQAIAEVKAAIDDANQAKAVAEASAVKNRELQAIALQKSAMTAKKVPLILGGLAVVTAGAIFLARRGKSGKTAGYRRRR